MNHIGTITSISTSYLFFLALLWICKKKEGLRLLGDNGMVRNPVMLIGLQAGGIILFALPIVATGLSSKSFYYPNSWPAVIAIFLAIITVRTSLHLAENKYRQQLPITAKGYGTAFIILYLLLRIFFISAYELWFRGYLLKELLAIFDIPFAILLNVGLYCLLHLVNGKQETLACIPFGILLCMLCIWEGSAWPAILIHLALTLTYECVGLRKINNNKTLPNESIGNRSIRIPG